MIFKHSRIFSFFLFQVVSIWYKCLKNLAEKKLSGDESDVFLDCQGVPDIGLGNSNNIFQTLLKNPIHNSGKSPIHNSGKSTIHNSWKSPIHNSGKSHI